jgi:hypothetical protein
MSEGLRSQVAAIVRQNLAEEAAANACMAASMWRGRRGRILAYLRLLYPESPFARMA